MSTVNNGGAPDNRKTIYGILIAALVLTWGYIFYDKSQTKETIIGLENGAPILYRQCSTKVEDI
jgi:hypothetical protein